MFRKKAKAKTPTTPSSPSSTKKSTPLVEEKSGHFAQYDVVVIGGGPIGLATAFALKKRGKKVLVLERFTVGNDKGSSGDKMRMLRSMYTEDFMARFAVEALDDWKQLQEDVKTELVWRTGLMNYGDGVADTPEGSLFGPVKNLEDLGLKYRGSKPGTGGKVLDQEWLEKNTPFENVDKSYDAVIGYDNAVINVPLTIRTLHKAITSGENAATVIENAKVDKIQVSWKGAYINDDSTPIPIRYTINNVPHVVTADKIVIATGAYANHVLTPSFGIALNLSIWEMQYTYFKETPVTPKEAAVIANNDDNLSKDVLLPKSWYKPPGGKSVYRHDERSRFKRMFFQFSQEVPELGYGFPSVSWGLNGLPEATDSPYIRVSIDQSENTIKDPNERIYGPDFYNKENSAAIKFVQDHFSKSLNPTPSSGGSALMANMFDNMFVLDHVPFTRGRIAIQCSGWAMKFVPWIGRVLTSLLLDGTYPKSKNGKIDEGYKNFAFVRSGSEPGQHSLRGARRDSTHEQFSLKACRGEKNSKPTLENLIQAFRVGSRVLDHDKLVVTLHRSDFPSLDYREDVLKTVLQTKIGILGAGMAGLYAAMILEDLEFSNYKIFESSQTHLGGRIRTRRFADFHEHSQSYIDWGAMRFPKMATMARVTDPNFKGSLLTKLREEGYDVELKTYALTTRGYYYNNIYASDKQMATEDDPLHFGAQYNDKDEPFVPVPIDKEHTPDWYVSAKINVFVKAMESPMDPVTGETKGFSDEFKKILQEDSYSMRTWLASSQPFVKVSDSDDEQLKVGVRAYSQALIQWLETFESATGLYDRALTEMIMDTFDFTTQDWQLIQGGTSVLTDGMLTWLSQRREARKEVANAEGLKNMKNKEIAYHGVQSGSLITALSPVYVGEKITGIDVEYQHTVPTSLPSPFDDGESEPIFDQKKATKKNETFEHVISTLPFSCFRTLQTKSLPLGLGFRMAMRSLKYDSATKCGLSFKSRWWETKLQHYGGSLNTDLPLRTIVYPSYGTNTQNWINKEPLEPMVEEGAVLMASYTWSQDAVRLGSLASADREQARNLVLDNLAEIYSKINSELNREFFEKELLEVTFWDWNQDKFALGAFGLFGPGDFTLLYPSVIKPLVDGHLHIAGEASSVHHAWVIGALNSAYRSVYNILDTLRTNYPLESRLLIARLYERWGKVDEVERGPIRDGHERSVLELTSRRSQVPIYRNLSGGVDPPAKEQKIEPRSLGSIEEKNIISRKSPIPLSFDAKRHDFSEALLGASPMASKKSFPIEKLNVEKPNVVPNWTYHAGVGPLLRAKNVGKHHYKLNPLSG